MLNKFMHLISLNTQCGSNFETLMKFVREQAGNTDIFCFQEVLNEPKIVRSVIKNPRLNLYAELKNVLTNYQSFFCEPEEKDMGGLAIFVRNNMTVNKSENIVIFPMVNAITDRSHKDYFTAGRNVQFIEIVDGQNIYSIINFHGIYTMFGKLDSEKRIEQSMKVRKIFDDAKGKKILCGDLNISPSTESYKILAQGNKDLIGLYNIKSTRSPSKGRDEIVDYVVVSPDVHVSDFNVPNADVSDHLPLILGFE